RIQLLGSFQVIHGSQPLAAINTNRLQSLLAYLFLHEGAQSRERLAFLLWPDSADSQARTNLRQLLHNLRRALPAECEYLAGDNHTVEWRRDSGCSFDFVEFDEALARAERAEGPARIDALEQAAGLYQDELLRGLYDEWIQPVRDRYNQQLAQALATLVSLYA